MRQIIPMILIRVLVSIVFLTEGTLKFLLPDEFGSGRFTAIGLPFPHFLAPFTGVCEIVGGAAILLALYAGDAALMLLIDIFAALFTTKLPILLGHSIGPFTPAAAPHSGWLAFLHESRTDLAMFFCLLAILIDAGLHLGRRRPWYQSKGL